MVSDLYIRVIPGMIVLTTFILPVLLATLITTPPSNPSTFQQIAIQGGNWLLVIFAVFSLLTGELINLIREQWVPVPHIFRKIVYNETGDRNSLSFWQRRKSRVSEIDPNDYCLLLSWVIIAIQKFIQIDDYEFQWLLTENGKIKTFSWKSDGRQPLRFLAFYLIYYFSSTIWRYFLYLICIDDIINIRLATLYLLPNAISNYRNYLSLIKHNGGIESLIRHR